MKRYLKTKQTVISSFSMFALWSSPKNCSTLLIERSCYLMRGFSHFHRLYAVVLHGAIIGLRRIPSLWVLDSPCLSRRLSFSSALLYLSDVVLVMLLVLSWCSPKAFGLNRCWLLDNSAHHAAMFVLFDVVCLVPNGCDSSLICRKNNYVRCLLYDCLTGEQTSEQWLNTIHQQIHTCRLHLPRNLSHWLLLIITPCGLL